jgi:hypothetical protein
MKWETRDCSVRKDSMVQVDVYSRIAVGKLLRELLVNEPLVCEIQHLTTCLLLCCMRSA